MVFLILLDTTGSLDYQIRIPHQALIHSMCSFSAFADCPHHQRLSPVHIAGDEYIFHTGLVFHGGRLYNGAII